MATPFTINVDQAVLDDLQERLAATRWTDEVDGAGWDYGTNLGFLRELATYWQNGYDWRTQEAKLNEFAQFHAEVDGFNLHFIHEHGTGANPMPLLLLHGWPDSFYRMVKVIPMLTNPASVEGDEADSFDVVVPSLPGFGFSELPQQRGWSVAESAEVLYHLMTEELGYQKFAVHGGDTGSPLAQKIAMEHPESVVAVHLTDIGWHALGNLDPATLSDTEQAYAQKNEAEGYVEGAYAMIQGSKPQTLAYGLNDSPVGVAAWILEKFYTWSDCDGNLENSYIKDELLTNVMIYWVTQTINSSIRGYYEGFHGASIEPDERVDVPVGLALFPKEMAGIPPRELAERTLNVQHWTEMPKGGHFAALEEPELLVNDMRKFLGLYRA